MKTIFFHQAWLKLSIIIFYLRHFLGCNEKLYFIFFFIKLKLIDVVGCIECSSGKRSWEEMCVGNQSIIPDNGKFLTKVVHFLINFAINFCNKSILLFEKANMSSNLHTFDDLNTFFSSSFAIHSLFQFSLQYFSLLHGLKFLFFLLFTRAHISCCCRCYFARH